MHSRQLGIPGRSHQMVANLTVLSGTAYRRRSPDNNCQVGLLNNLIDLLEVVWYLLEPYNAWLTFQLPVARPIDKVRSQPGRSRPPQFG